MRHERRRRDPPNPSGAHPRRGRPTRQEHTPASLYAGLIGGVLVVAGIIGFFYSASFGSPGNVDAVFGILDVNAWHNLVHILTGAIGLAAFAAGARASRTYAIAFGAIYVVVAIWGFIIGSGDSILGFIPVNTEDNFLHVILGVLGIAAGLSSPDEKAVARRAATAPRQRLSPRAT